jgi:hypothetical protein
MDYFRTGVSLIREASYAFSFSSSSYRANKSNLGYVLLPDIPKYRLGMRLVLPIPGGSAHSPTNERHAGPQVMRSLPICNPRKLHLRVGSIRIGMGCMDKPYILFD